MTNIDIDFIKLLPAMLGAGALISALIQLIEVIARTKRGKEETTEDRIRRLTNSLREATKLISHIESEIVTRSALAEKLQKDIDLHDKLMKLKEPEIEAVAQLLRGELKKEGKRTFWKGFAINFIFFIIGIFTTWLFQKLK